MTREDPPDGSGPGLGIAETVDVAAPGAPAGGHDKTTPAPPLSPSPSPKSASPSASLPGGAGGELPLVDPEHYEILGVHGRGGLGRILRARDRRTGRIVAIKEILHDHVSVIARFQREALVTANLQHPAIVPVYEVGRWPTGKPFYAMKLVVGRTLAEAIELAGSLTGRLALLPHAAQVADALAYAHDQGWIHRDLKPANVLVGGFGETVVIDWGLARRRKLGPGELAELDAGAGGGRVLASRPPSIELPPSADGGDTQAGTVVGTPVYMAPEQARGETIDARADVYAIGALLYHVLGGVAPYRECRSADDVIAKVAVSPPRPLADLATELPPDLVAIVERAMARDPDQRYPTAAELSIDLGRFLAGALVEAHEYTLGERLRRFVRRHRGAVVVAAILTAALVTVSAVAIRNVIVARDTAQAERGRAESARALAERESGEARRSLAALHRELGRTALADGAPGRALPHLARALRSMHDDDDHGVMRVATGLAVESLHGARGTIDVGAPVFAIQVEAGRVLPATMAATQRVWSLDDGSTRTFDGVHGRLSPDGREVATRSADFRTVEVRHLDHGGRIATLSGDGIVFLDGFAADDRLWVGFDGGLVRRWKLGAAATPDGEVTLPSALHRIHVGSAGRWGIAAGSHGEVWRFDLERGAVTVLDPGGAGRPDVEAVRVLGDARVAAFAADGAVRLWGPGDRVARTVADAPSGGLPAATRDGRFVALRARGTRVRVLDTAAATLGPPLAEAATGDSVVAISSDGRVVATGDGAGAVAVWRVADGTHLATSAGHADAVTAIAFADDDRTVISASASGDVRAWRYDDAGRALAIHHEPRVLTGAFVGSDRVITVGADRIGRITATTGQELATLAGDVEMTDVDQTAGLIATCAADGIARLWKPDGKPGAVLGKPGTACTVAIAPTGARVAVARDTTISVYRLDGTFERDIEASGSIERLVWARDGTRLFAIHPDALSLWDSGSGKRIASIETRGAPRGLELAPDHDLAAIRTDGYEVEVVSTRTGASVFVIALDQRMAAIGWSDDSSLLVATRSGRLDQFDHRGKRLASFPLGDDTPTTLAVRPDGALIAVGDELGQVTLWERATGRILTRRTTGHEVTHLGWSEDGTRLLVVTAGPEATLWDLSPYAGTLDDLDRLIRCRAPFQLDGDRLVAATPPADCHPDHFVDAP